MTTINPSRPAIPPAARPVPSAAAGAGPIGVPAIDPLKLLQKYKWVLAIAAAVGVVLGTVGHFAWLKIHPIYRTAVIFECLGIETDPGVIGMMASVKDELDGFKATQIQAMLSENTINNTVNDPRLLQEAPGWTSQFMSGGAFDTNKAAQSLRRSLSAGAVGQSNLIRLSFSWTDPDEVVAVAQAVARNYEADRRRSRHTEIHQRRDVLRDQVLEAEREILRLQQERRRILREDNVDALDAAKSSATHEMEVISGAITQLRLQKESVDVQLQEMNAELASPVGINYSDTIRDRVDRELTVMDLKREINMLEAELGRMRIRVGPEHRTRRHMSELLDSKRQVLADTTERLLRQAFDAQHDALRMTKRAIDAQILDQMNELERARQRATELTQILAQVNDIDMEITRLNDSKASFANDLRRLEVITAGQSQTRIVQVQSAQRPREVSFPKLYIMIPMGLALVVGMVGGLIFLVELVDQRVKSPADVAMIPRTRVLGLVAHAAEDPANPPKVETVFRDQPGGVMAEHFRQLRGTILKRMQQGGHKSLVVMSGMPDSGATAVITNLALSLAAAEHRVLVIDANFRRPGVHRALGLPEAPGLADVLAGSSSLGDATQSMESGRLNILPAGSADNRMFERLGTRAMADVLRDAASQYDMVLVDVAPAMVSGDALAVANRADATMLVVRALGEKRGMVARLRNDLEDARAEFLGVLVNAARSAAGGYLRGNIMATHKYRNNPEAK